MAYGVIFQTHAGIFLSLTKDTQIAAYYTIEEALATFGGFSEKLDPTSSNFPANSYSDYISAGLGLLANPAIIKLPENAKGLAEHISNMECVMLDCGYINFGRNLFVQCNESICELIVQDVFSAIFEQIRTNAELMQEISEI